MLPRHKKKKQIESKKWLSSRARKPRVGTDFQVNIASIPAFEPKKDSDNNIKKNLQLQTTYNKAKKKTNTNINHILANNNEITFR